jgi:hypothetical protein
MLVLVLGVSVARSAAASPSARVQSTPSPEGGTAVPAPKPTATLSSHGVATARCATTCTVVLQAHRRAHLHSYRVRLERTLPTPGTVTMRLPGEALRRLGRGRALFSVEIDGTPITSRTVTVS